MTYRTKYDMKHAFKVISFITIFFYTRLKIFDNASLDHNQIKKKKKQGIGIIFC